MNPTGGLDARGLPERYPFKPGWEITPREALEKERAGGLVVVDVRTPEEFAIARVAGSLHIPLDELPARLEEIDPEKGVAFLCHHGIRSMKAAAFARQQGLDGALSVAGGIDLWSLGADDAVPRYERGPEGCRLIGPSRASRA